MTTPPRRPSAAARATRRSRRPAPGRTSFLQKHRNRLLWIGGLLGFVLLASAVYANSTRPTYACADVFEPTPGPSFAGPTRGPAATAAPATPTPAPTAAPSGPTPKPTATASPTEAPVTAPPPGFVQPDQGAGHVSAGTTVRYSNCPPASGKHYNDTGLGPIPARFYGKDEAPAPPGWVHNLEHGAIVLLYSCKAADGTDTAEACTDAGQAALRDLLTRWPDSPYCKIPPGALTPVIARFDDMASPYAAVVWDAVLPLETLDEGAIFDFYAERGERYNPEPQCNDPTPTPGPVTPTVAPSAGPPGSPGASPAGSSGASPAASPAAAPAATAAAPAAS